MSDCDRMVGRVFREVNRRRRSRRGICEKLAQSSTFFRPQRMSWGLCLSKCRWVQITVKSILEIDDRVSYLVTLDYDVLDDERHIHQLRQRIAGNRVCSFNTIHLQYPRLECAKAKVIYNQLWFLKQNSRNLMISRFFSKQGQKIALCCWECG